MRGQSNTQMLPAVRVAMSKTLLIVTIITLCGTSYALPRARRAAATDEGKMDVFRLPNDTEPLLYRLNIGPIVPVVNGSADEFTFSGDVTVRVRARMSTAVLTMNADRELNISAVEVTDMGTAAKVAVDGYEIVDRNEQLKIRLGQPGLIADQEYEVKITYSARLRDDMTGFYKSSYVDRETKMTKWLAVTQFEPTYARRAFPCYDEPAFKTPFTITVMRKDTEISLSNMLRDKSYQLPSDKQPIYINDQYYTSPPISTYLVAFSVSEFVNATNDNQRVFVYTHKDNIDQVSYIDSKANTLLNMMEIYTNIPYPFPKIDLLAVPDFSFGAMENWGLNTYKEKYLLVSDKSREKDKEMVTTVVQHELSHQWFGDLVTCSWWNYVWLNEAFATLFEYFAVHVAEPEWRIGDLFVIEQHQEALSYDHRPRHPITASVNTPNEIEDIFDKITYNKGASVLRMLKYTMSDDIFRTSITRYLKTNMYKSVEPNNLWDAFDNVLFESEYKLGILGDSITVGEFMRSWTDQAGYPVIFVQTNNSDGSLTVTQKQYQVDKPKTSDTTLWYIGLTFTTQKDAQFNLLNPTVWMKNTESKITIKVPENFGWVLFNLQSTGFYRVNYDSRNWNRLITALKNDPKNMHVLNRAQLIDDSFSLARAGELPYSIPFTLVEYLDKENDFIPWYSVLNSMSYIVERSRSCSHTGPQVQQFAKTYAKIVYKKVSDLYEKHDNKHLTKTSMNAFSNWACKLEVEECTESVLKYFNEWKINGTEIPPDVKEAALCVGVKNGTEETWNNVFELFNKTLSTSERQAALSALSCSSNTTILSKYLDLLLQDNCPIRPQDYKIVFKSLASTPDGINVMTNFLKNKINESLSNMWEAEDTISRMFSTLASNVATNNEIKELNSIRNLTYLTPALEESFNESYKEVELNSAYFERAHPALHEWFNPKKESSTQAPSSGAISRSYVNAIVLSLIFIGVTFLKNNYL